MQSFTTEEISRHTKNGTLNDVVPRANPLLENNIMIHHITDLSQLPKRNYTIKRFELEQGTLASVCAAGGSGKSMLLQYLAVCVSSGTPIFGEFQTTKGKVVHIDMEQSNNQTLRRYSRLANGLEVSKVNIQRCTLINPLDQKDKQEETKSWLIELCKGSALVIIDSLKACTIAEENSDQIGESLKMLKQIAEAAKTTILVITHKGKKNSEARQSNRGHSVIYDKMDVQLDLEMKDGIYEISCAKNREGAYFPGLIYQMIDCGDFIADQNCTTKLCLKLLQKDVKVKNHDKTQQILEVLAKCDEPIKHSGLYEFIKGDRDHFNEVLESMQTQNLIREDVKGKSRLYSIGEEGRAWLTYAK